MANYNSSQDILREALNRVGELTDGTSEYEAKALEYLNKWHLSICGGGNELGIDLGEPWSWAKAQFPKAFYLEAPYVTGTVSLTNGSPTLTFSNAPAASLAGWHVKITGLDDVLRISAHTAASSSATLDVTFGGASISGTFSAFKIDYTLAYSILRFIGPFRHNRSGNNLVPTNGTIDQIGIPRFNQSYPLHMIRQEIPTALSVIFQDNGGVGTQTVRFSSYPDIAMKVEFDYIPIPADLTNSTSNYPLVPREHRIALVYGVAYFLALDKNDNRSQEYRGLCQASLQALVNSSRKERIHSNSRLGQMNPRQDNLGYRGRIFYAGDYK